MQSQILVGVLMFALIAAATTARADPNQEAGSKQQSVRGTSPCRNHSEIDGVRLYSKPEVIRALRATSSGVLPYSVVTLRYPAAHEADEYIQGTKLSSEASLAKLSQAAREAIANEATDKLKLDHDQDLSINDKFMLTDKNKLLNIDRENIIADEASVAKDTASLLDPPLISDGERSFILNSILLNALEINYIGSEELRSNCESLVSGISAGGLGVATIMQIIKSGAGTSTLYGWAIAGVLPIMALDISGDANSRPLYGDAASGLRKIHERYFAMYIAMPDADKLNIAEADDMQQADDCESTLTQVVKYLKNPSPNQSEIDNTSTNDSRNATDKNIKKVNKKKNSKGASVADAAKQKENALKVEKSNANLLANNLTAACKNYAASRLGLAEFVEAAKNARGTISSYMAEDALDLDEAVIRRDRLTRPEPHQVPGLIIGAPIKAITSALTGGSSYNYSPAASMWNDKDISLTLHSVTFPKLPSKVTIDNAIGANLKALQPPTTADEDGLASDADPKPAVNPCAGTTKSLPCQIFTMAALDKSLTSASKKLNDALAKATTLRATFNVANNQTNLDIRIGSINPVTLKASPASGAAASDPASTDASSSAGQ